MDGSEGTLEREAARYRPARGDKRCGTCASFDPGAGLCAILAGPIAANMVCDRWTLMPGLTRRNLEPPPRR